MGIFKDEVDSKRVIFNINLDIAERLEEAKKNARQLGKKLDVDGTLNKALDKFLKKAEKKLAEMLPEEKRNSKKKSNEIPLNNQLESDSDLNNFNESEEMEKNHHGDSYSTMLNDHEKGDEDEEK